MFTYPHICPHCGKEIIVNDRDVIEGLNFTGAEIDMLACMAEQNGNETITEYIHERLLKVAWHDWTNYQISLVQGIKSIMDEDMISADKSENY